MKVNARRMDPRSFYARERLSVRLVPVISQTGVVAYSYTPGFPFQVVRVRSYCRVKAGTVSAAVKVGGRSSTAVAFTQATEVDNTQSATTANNKGSSTEALTVEYTTDGSGSLTDAYLVIEIRDQLSKL